MDARLVGLLDFETALAGEIQNRPFLLPSHHIESALQGAAAFHPMIRSPELAPLARYCEGRFTVGQELYPAEVLTAAKSPKGRRPVHVLSFEQRVAYRALVQGLEAELPSIDRSDEAWRAFQNGPLESEDYRYLVRTDVVGFYQCVDHGVLVDELVARTGQATIALEIGQFLRTVVGARGLPQNLGPSHILAEYYLDVVERGLLRSGHPVWRFSDDIILAASSWAGINAALAELSDRLRSVGLMINEEKTRFFRQDTYRAWIEHPLERLQAAGGVELLAVVSDYDSEEPPDQEDRQLDLVASQDSAVDLITRSLAAHTSAERNFDRLDEAVNRKVIRAALRLLSLIGSPSAVELVPALVKFEPQLTPAVSSYLNAISAAAHLEDARSALRAVIEDKDTHVSPWQASWLVQPLLRTEDGFDNSLVDWLRQLLLSPAALTRARAAEALAWPDQIDVTELTRLYDSAPLAVRPDFVVAIALRCWDPEAPPVVSVSTDSPFNALVAQQVRPS